MRTATATLILAGSPDFVKLAEAYGVKGLRATNKEEARACMAGSAGSPGPVVDRFRRSQGRECVSQWLRKAITIDEMLMGDSE